MVSIHWEFCSSQKTGPLTAPAYSVGTWQYLLNTGPKEICAKSVQNPLICGGGRLIEEDDISFHILLPVKMLQRNDIKRDSNSKYQIIFMAQLHETILQNQFSLHMKKCIFLM